MFSVIIPCYNCAPWINRALDSVAAQTYPAHEVIVIDDGSADHSLEQIKRSTLRPRLLQCRHGGASVARNEGIRAANGTWIAFLDGDDFWYPNHLQHAADLIEKGGNQDVALTGVIDLFMKDSPDVIRRPPNRWPLHKATTGLTHEDFIRACMYDMRLGFISSFVKRARLLEVEGFDSTQKRRNDIEMWLRAIHGCTWGFNPIYTAAHQSDTPNGISRNRAACEYYLLRAFLKSNPLYQSEEYSKLLRVLARQTLSCAYTDGDAADRERAHQLAAPYLTHGDQALFSMVQKAPLLYRHLNRILRWLLKGRPYPKARNLEH